MNQNPSGDPIVSHFLTGLRPKLVFLNTLLIATDCLSWNRLSGISSALSGTYEAGGIRSIKRRMRKCLGEFSQYRCNNDRSPKFSRCASKVWEEITIPTYAKHLVLMPYRKAKFEPDMVAVLFEFQRHGMPADEFFSRLAQFFLKLASTRDPLCSSAITAWCRSRAQSLVQHAVPRRPTLTDARVHGATTPHAVGDVLCSGEEQAEPYTKLVEEPRQMQRNVGFPTS